MRIPSSSLLLRAAAVVCLLFALGHMSGYPWTPAEAPDARAVIDGMQHVHFQAEGARCSYWGFYLGFGHLVGAGLAVLASMIWYLAPLGRELPRRAFPATLCALLFMLLNAWISQTYFFYLPTTLAAVTALLLMFALVQLRRDQTRGVT